jgi:hypothetical protein
MSFNPKTSFVVLEGENEKGFPPLPTIFRQEIPPAPRLKKRGTDREIGR